MNCLKLYHGKIFTYSSRGSLLLSFTCYRDFRAAISRLHSTPDWFTLAALLSNSSFLPAKPDPSVWVSVHITPWFSLTAEASTPWHGWEFMIRFRMHSSSPGEWIHNRDRAGTRLHSSQRRVRLFCRMITAHYNLTPSLILIYILFVCRLIYHHSSFIIVCHFILHCFTRNCERSIDREWFTVLSDCFYSRTEKSILTKHILQIPSMQNLLALFTPSYIQCVVRHIRKLLKFNCFPYINNAPHLS